VVVSHDDGRAGINVPMDWDEVSSLGMIGCCGEAGAMSGGIAPVAVRRR
jgi:hypothetical protein